VTYSGNCCFGWRWFSSRDGCFEQPSSYWMLSSLNHLMLFLFWLFIHNSSAVDLFCPSWPYLPFRCRIRNSSVIIALIVRVEYYDLGHLNFNSGCSEEEPSCPEGSFVNEPLDSELIVAMRYSDYTASTAMIALRLHRWDTRLATLLVTGLFAVMRHFDHDDSHYSPLWGCPSDWKRFFAWIDYWNAASSAAFATSIASTSTNFAYCWTIVLASLLLRTDRLAVHLMYCFHHCQRSQSSCWYCRLGLMSLCSSSFTDAIAWTQLGFGQLYKQNMKVSSRSSYMH